MEASSKDRKWSPGAVITLGVALVLLFVPLISALIGFQYPSDGWTSMQEDSGGYRLDTQVTTQPTPLQADDLIVAIEGQQLLPGMFPPLPPNLKVGQTLRYTIQREGELLDVDVRLVQRKPSEVVDLVRHYIPANLLFTVVPYLGLLVAGFVFLLRPGSPAARYMLLIYVYYSNGVFGAADYHLYNTTYPPVLYLEHKMEAFGWWLVFFPSWTLLALSVPVQKWPLSRFPRLLPALLYGAPMAVFLLAMESTYTTHSDPLSYPILTPIVVIITSLFPVALFGSLIHSFRTLREPVMRAQLRWIALGLGVGWGIPVTLMSIALLAKLSNPVSFFGFTFILTVLQPVTFAVAILRYRLFEIDILIRRTLVYGALSILLVMVYLGSVVMLQGLWGEFSGEAGQPPLVIVASTLASAALFSPLRRRVQESIDRRYYRRRYDAAHTLQTFSASVRDEVDLERLEEHLVSVVHETIQPESVSLWLSSPRG